MNEIPKKRNESSIKCEPHSKKRANYGNGINPICLIQSPCQQIHKKETDDMSAPFDFFLGMLGPKNFL